MSYLTRGPSALGIDSKAHASREPTPFRPQIVIATGGEGMSAFTTSAWTCGGMPFLASHAHSPTSFSRIQPTPQAAP